MRIILMPGFGEDTFCFNELLSYFKNYDVIHVDYRPTLNQFIFPFINVNSFAKKLIENYNITKEDKIIGHSMGGYFAFQIREILETEICMIGSFNDPNKLIHVMPNFKRLSSFMAISGLIKTPVTKKFFAERVKEERYRKVLFTVMDNMHNFSNIQLALMMEMNFAPKILSHLPNPLRIHDKNDRVVKSPDEKYIQVNGGHFCLNLFPSEVHQAMKDNRFL